MKLKIILTFFLIVFVISSMFALAGLGATLENDEAARNNQALECGKVTIHCVGE